MKELIVEINKLYAVIDSVNDYLDYILESFEKIPDKELLSNRCVDIEVIKEIRKKLEVNND